MQLVKMLLAIKHTKRHVDMNLTELKKFEESS